MKHPSILRLLLLCATLAACSGGGESASESAGASYELPNVPASSASGGDAAVANATMDEAAVSAPAQGAAPAAQPNFASTDTAGVVVPQAGTVPGEPSVSLNPMLIRTGTATVQVDSLETGIAAVRSLAQRVGGIVGNTSITAGTSEARRAQIELRIPSANFDRAVSGLTPVGTVETVNVTAEDVGEEYTDVTARVANSRRLEARLLDLLDTRSGRLDEVLGLEREVARVREEIERYEGRLRYLRTRASISMLTITLHEPGSTIGTPPGERPIRDAFVIAWQSFIRMIAGLIASLGVLIPLGFLAFLGWRAFGWMRRREAARDAAYRESLRRERERQAATAAEAEPEVPATRP